jgi:hypothetical protein
MATAEAPGAAAVDVGPFSLCFKHSYFSSASLPLPLPLANLCPLSQPSPSPHLPPSPLRYSSLAEELALFFDSEASSAVAACRVMLPLLRVNAISLSSSFAVPINSRSVDGGDAADGIVGALLEFEDAAGAWLREMAMQQQQHKHHLSKAKKFAIGLEAAAAKLNAARRALTVIERSCASSSSHQNSNSSLYHVCMSRHDPPAQIYLLCIFISVMAAHTVQSACFPRVCGLCARVDDCASD